MGGWGTDSPGRAFIRSILRPRFCERILGWEEWGRGGCALEWSTSFKMAEILMLVCYLQFEFVKPGISPLHLKGKPLRARLNNNLIRKHLTIWATKYIVPFVMI